MRSARCVAMHGFACCMRSVIKGGMRRCLTCSPSDASARGAICLSGLFASVTALFCFCGKASLGPFRDAFPWLLCWLRCLRYSFATADPCLQAAYQPSELPVAHRPESRPPAPFPGSCRDDPASSSTRWQWPETCHADPWLHAIYPHPGRCLTRPLRRPAGGLHARAQPRFCARCQAGCPPGRRPALRSTPGCAAPAAGRLPARPALSGT